MREPLNGNHTKYWRLRRCVLFDCLSDADVKALCDLCDMRVLERGARVYDVGEPGDRVLVVQTGAVSLSRVGDDGREVNVGVLGPTDIFGERALSQGTQRCDRAAILEDAVVCSFSSEGFRRFLLDHPELALRVTRLIGERLRQVENKIQDILFKDVRTRLAHTVAGLASKFGEDTPGGRRIAMRLTQTDLAQIIGSTRETTSTIFNEFRREGLVDNEGHYIIVRDAGALAVY